MCEKLAGINGSGLRTASITSEKDIDNLEGIRIGMWDSTSYYNITWGTIISFTTTISGIQLLYDGLNQKFLVRNKRYSTWGGWIRLNNE